MAIYTTADKVKTRLLVPTNTRSEPDPDNPGQMRQVDVWQGDFGTILDDCITAAEDMLDLFVGRSFRPATGTETREYEYRGGRWLKTDDLDDTASIVLTEEDDTLIPSGRYRLHRPFRAWVVRRDARIDPATWPVAEGAIVKVVGNFGWPTVPAPVTEAATRAAAELFRSGELRHGMVMDSAGMAYAKQPMASIFKALRPFRTKAL